MENIHMIYMPWLSRRRLMVPCKLLGTWQGKYLQFVRYSKKRWQYYTHMRLYYNVQKFGWWKFGKFLVSCHFYQIFVAPKFPFIQYVVKETDSKVVCFTSFCHHCLATMNIHMHEYHCTLFESVMKTGLWTFTSCGKDIALLYKPEE